MTQSPDSPYPPLDTSAPQLTLRAVLTGMTLGGILSLCNIYASLQIGWSTNMSVAGVLLAFAMWKAVGACVPRMRPFGMLENNINQAACSAGAAVSSAGLVAPIPALTLMTGTVLPWPQLALWVFSVCLVGICAAIVVRRQMIEVDCLPFPSGLACAHTLREVYGTGSDAIRRVLMLVAGAAVAGAVKVLDEMKWITPLQLRARVGGHQLNDLGFQFEPNLLFVGVGALIGTRGAWSIMLGAVVAWGVLAPWALNQGYIRLKAAEPMVALPEAVAIDSSDRLQHKPHQGLLEYRGPMTIEDRDRYLGMSDDVAWRAAIERLSLESDAAAAARGDASWRTVVELGAVHGVMVPDALADRYSIVGTRLVVLGQATDADVEALSRSVGAAAPSDAASAAIEGLVGRTALRPVVANFTDVVEWLLWPGVTLMVVASLTAFALQGRSIVRAFRAKGGMGGASSGDMPLRWFAPLALVALVLSVVAQIVLFGIPWWTGIIAVVLSVVLAIVAVRVSGETNSTPIGAMGKVTQLAFGAMLPAQPVVNLMTANVTGGAASQAADLMHDLKTGALLGATPWKQAVGQICGAAAGAMAGSAIYLMLIHDPQRQLFTPEWPAPAVATWKAVAELFQRGIEALPAGAAMAMLVAAAIGLVMPMADRWASPRVKAFLPSASSVGLSFVVAAGTSVSIFVGGMLALIASRIATTWTSRFLVTLAAGFVVGDSLVGAGNAMITVARGLLGP